MNVVHLSTLVYIVILIHYSISDHNQCPVHNTIGCLFSDNTIYCPSDYLSDNIPIFSSFNIIYKNVI